MKLMSDKTELSVIMPCYNEHERIHDAIMSILEQSYRNFEFIIVDDCSTDESPVIIKKMMAEDPRIIYLRNDENMGVAASLNHGLSRARGEFIARMDADDTCEKDRLYKQLIYMKEHPECVLCGTYGDVYTGEGTNIQGYVKGDLKKALVRNNFLIHTSVVFPRVISGWEVRYSQEKGFEDYDLWIELSKHGEFHVIPEILVHRNDINNVSHKKAWEGLNKHLIYKRLRKYQLKAGKATGHMIYALYCSSITAIKELLHNIKEGKLR